MAMSKKDLARRHASLKMKIEKLELDARMDPLKKKPYIHEELAKLKQELGAA